MFLGGCVRWNCGSDVQKWRHQQNAAVNLVAAISSSQISNIIIKVLLLYIYCFSL